MILNCKKSQNLMTYSHQISMKYQILHIFYPKNIIHKEFLTKWKYAQLSEKINK